MSMVRCGQCHASIPVPEDLEARTMQCQYCGAVQAVPDQAARERALWERKRHEAYMYQAEQEAWHREQEAMREAHREHEDRKERKSGIRWGRVTTIFSMLLAPAIISVTVFDLPARLGFGGDGSDRLNLVVQQLESRGCKAVAKPASLYTKSAVTTLAPLESGCLRVIAAGGPDQDSLKVKIFDLDGKEVAVSPESSDPQLEHCPKQAGGSLRYEVLPGMMDKGRLTHVALACPAKPAAAEPTDPKSADDKPAEKGKRKPGRAP
jgi:hypothetical protein